MKIIRNYILSFIFVALFGTVGALAQTGATTSQATKQPQSKSVLVASVNIYNATNTKINNSTYAISFRIQNNSGIQSNIRYGIQLVRKSDSLVADTNLANEAITLGENEYKDITMQYILPSFIPNDIYRLVIVAQNQNGLPLGYMPAGFPEKMITVGNNPEGVSIDSCYLTVSSESSTDKKYTNLQGVDIKKEEELVAHCSLSNKSLVSSGKLKIQMITHKRDQMGDVLNNTTLDKEISMGAKDVEEFDFNVPTVDFPQSYYVDLFLVNSRGEKVSQSYYMRYVVSGPSATIQNFVLDKSNYKKGDTANLKVFWSPSADTFGASRFGGTKESYSINAKINDEKGNLCGSVNKEIKSTSILGEEVLKINMSRDCANVVAKVEILDSKGNVLDSSIVDIKNKSEKIDINQNVPYVKNIIPSFNKTYVIFFVIVLALIAYGILTLRKNHNMISNN